MNILITGSTGFIGSHLAHQLSKPNHRLILLKRIKSNPWRLSDIAKKLIFYDIDSLNILKKVFEENKIDLIIHLATKYVKLEKTPDEIKQMNEVNIHFPSLLLSFAVGNQVKYFINTGTCFEHKLTGKKITEKTPAQAYNYYAATKLAFEEILKYFASQNKIRAITLKLFYPYGEKDNEKIIPLIIKSFIKGETLFVTKGEQKLNFTYVGDIIDAYMQTIKFITSTKYVHYENFNIGNNRSYTLGQLIAIIEKISGKPNKINLGALPYAKNEIMSTVCDCNKAKKMLHWSPKTDIFSGLSKTYNYYLKNII